MPSVVHQILVELFQRRPTLAPELLRDALGQHLPDFDYVELADADLSQIVPAEYRADQVLILRSRDECDRGTDRTPGVGKAVTGKPVAGKPVLGIVLEVQLARDEDKRFSWPCYQVTERARLRCPCCLLVVTPFESVARWAAKPIDTGQPGATFTPLVLGPRAVPVITEADEAQQRPELALLSVLAHGKSARGYDVGLAAYQGAVGLDRETRMLYSDMILQAVHQAARSRMEDWMRIEDYEFKSDLALRNQAKGRAEGTATTLLKILAARGLQITEDQKARILGCTDLDTLDAWTDRALQIASVDEILH